MANINTAWGEDNIRREDKREKEWETENGEALMKPSANVLYVKQRAARPPILTILTARGLRGQKADYLRSFN